MRRTPHGCWLRRAICLAMNSCPCTTSAPLATRWVFWSEGRTSTASAASRAMMPITTSISTSVNPVRRRAGHRCEARMSGGLLLVERCQLDVGDVVRAGDRAVVLAVGTERQDQRTQAVLHAGPGERVTDGLVEGAQQVVGAEPLLPGRVGQHPFGVLGVGRGLRGDRQGTAERRG